MSEQVTLTVQKRTMTGKAVRQLRRQGMLPANVYGGHRPSIAIQIDARELTRILKAHGPTTLFRLAGAADRGDETVMIRHVQRGATSGAIQHIDFMHVEMSEVLRARIRIHVAGESPAVKLHGGILIHSLDTLEVEALPDELPETIQVDISELTELNSSIFVRDLQLPDSVKLLTNLDEPVITVSAPRSAPAEAAATETAAPLATPTPPSA
ncbi:MAG: 50S ribosomal protein L25 [Ktedonobacterales bacterium]|nr:50S ribosomal protein L25 [Ktedonobacterales bacterium]